jgi:hypothetical protein
MSDLRIKTTAFFRSNGASLLLLALLSLLAVLSIGDFKVLLANMPVDDNPIFYTHYYQNPDQYAGDIRAISAEFKIKSTFENWVPVLLWQWFNISPEVTTWVFTYLQYILFGFAVLYFIRQVTVRNDLAWLGVFFVFAAKPINWNLANYAFDFNMAIPAHLVMPFLVFAIIAVLKDRIIWTIGWLVVSGLTHPTMTAQVVAAVSVYWFLLFVFMEKDWRKWVGRNLLLVIVIAVCVIPPMLNTLGGAHVTTSELMKDLFLNWHAIPTPDKPGLRERLFSLTGYISLTILALHKLKNTPSKYGYFLGGVLGANIILSLALAAGWFLNIPRLVQLLPLRANAFLVLFSVPLVLLYLVDNITQKSFFARWASLALIILYARFEYGAWAGCLLVLLLSDMMNGGFGFYQFRGEVAKKMLYFLKKPWIYIPVSLLLMLLIKPMRIPHPWLPTASYSEYLAVVIMTAILSACLTSRQDLLRAFEAIRRGGLAAAKVFIRWNSPLARFIKHTFIVIGLAAVLYGLLMDYLQLNSTPGFGLVQIILMTAGAVLLAVGFAIPARWIYKCLDPGSHLLKTGLIVIGGGSGLYALVMDYVIKHSSPGLGVMQISLLAIGATLFLLGLLTPVSVINRGVSRLQRVFPQAGNWAQYKERLVFWAEKDLAEWLWIAGLLAAVTVAANIILVQLGLIPSGIDFYRSLLAVFGVGLIMAVVGLLSKLIGRLAPSISIPSLITLVITIGIAVFMSWNTGEQQTRSPYNVALYQAQLWARDNSPDDAVFIAFGVPWRTYSLRRAVDPRWSGSTFYTANQAAKDFDDAYLNFYGLGDLKERVIKGDVSFYDFYPIQKEAYDNLDENGVRRLAQQFGGDYLVRTTDAPTLDFPEVYWNEYFVIYQIQ